MKQLIKFILHLKSFWKLYRDYEYDGDTLRFIITQYETVLVNRTKHMSKATYCAREVIKQLDEWYGEREN